MNVRISMYFGILVKTHSRQKDVMKGYKFPTIELLKTNRPISGMMMPAPMALMSLCSLMI